ncbi:MAG TPA: site-specific DNA-methyltransferase [Ilumatobacter sp.]|nr:site-specific DNA-methyltransferase [Ilumatobacter sp.]
MIRPRTPVAALDRADVRDDSVFEVVDVARLVGMSAAFVRMVVGPVGALSERDVLGLLDQDAFGETYVPRSRIIAHLRTLAGRVARPAGATVVMGGEWELRCGHALDLLDGVANGSVNCVVTSTPYWGMRVYRDTHLVEWADGEACAYGHEQTPEGFARHTVEVLAALDRVLADGGSVWWNVMVTFNTRTQVRSSAVETLRAMQGRDRRRWSEHASRRYSAGHSYIVDGEQCLIPHEIAKRASRIGLHVRSVITWAKPACLREPHGSRVSRNVEYVLHLSKRRAPKFSRAAYNDTPAEWGGRTPREPQALCDVWSLSSSSGGGGHGAQFPVALPGRCIALSTTPGDVVLDPFVGSGTSGIAALYHRCRFVGLDTSPAYLAIAERRLRATQTIAGRGDLDPQRPMSV